MGFKMRRRAYKGKAPGKRGRQSGREREFILRWALLGGAHLEAQFKFHPARRWAFDWAHPQARVAIEINGGTWMAKSRHVSGRGYWGDRIKINAALRLNWKVFELTSDDIGDERVHREIMDEIERRLKEGVPGDREGMAPFAEVYPDHHEHPKRRP